MARKSSTIKEKKMKVYYNPEMIDQPFLEPMSYKLLVETPKELEDINKTEGEKLTGIESGADNFSSVAGNMAYEDLVEYAKLGTTLQVGGYLKTILIDAEYIQAGILTGRTIRTSSGNSRIEMTNVNDNPTYPEQIIFYMGGSIWARLAAVMGGLALYFPSNQAFNIQHVSAITSAFYPTYTETQWLVPKTAGYALGASDKKWGSLYLSGNVYVDGNVDGVDVSVLATNYNALVADYAAHVGNANAHHSSTSSGITIYPAGCFPYTGGGYNLGSASYYWNNLYISCIYYGSTLLLDFYSDKLACKKPFGFEVRAGTPGAASSFQGYMYYDTNQSDLVFSTGINWYKLTAQQI